MPAKEKTTHPGVINARIGVELHGRVAASAEQHGRTVTAEAIHLIEDGLKFGSMIGGKPHAGLLRDLFSIVVSDNQSTMAQRLVKALDRNLPRGDMDAALSALDLNRRQES